MSAVFSHVLQSFDTNNSQGDAGFLHALLKFADANHSGADVLANPYSEVARRFEAAGCSPHAVARIRAMLAAQEARYAQGAR